MSASLIKLIDAALIPAALMVGSKLVGVVGLISSLGLEWQVKDLTGTFLVARPAVSLTKLAEVSSYSDLFLLIVMSGATLVVIYRAIYLRSDRLPPRLLARIAERNLLNLVSGSFDIFYQGSIWTVFSWATTVTILINTLGGKTYAGIAIAALVISLSFTVLLLRDVYWTIELGRKKLGRELAF